MTKSAGRTGRFNCLVSDDERKMLNQLAADDGLTSSDIVRKLVRQEYNARALKRDLHKPGKGVRR